MNIYENSSDNLFFPSRAPASARTWKHFLHLHQWCSPRGKNIAPIWQDSTLQTFFADKCNIRYFKVHPQGCITPPPRILNRGDQLHTFFEVETDDEHSSSQPFLHISENAPWLTRTGYAKYLAELPSKEEAIQLYRLPKEDEEPALFMACEALDAVLQETMEAVGMDKGKRRLTTKNALSFHYASYQNSR